MKRSHKLLWCGALPVLLLAFCVLSPGFAQAQMTSVGIDCSQVASLHLLMQDNQRAGRALMECGVIPRHEQGGTAYGLEGDDAPVVPPNVLISNRTCTSGSSCTRSESMVWHSTRSGDNTVVVNFNANYGSSSCYAGVSYSTDNGATFTEIEPLCTGHGSNFGDPIVIYNQKQQKWYAGDLVTGCGGQGIGVWTSPDGINWTVGACAHNNSSDDRESMWVDNNPFSAKYGRMYISFNNFNVGGGALQLVYSDDGTTWSSAVTLNSGFIRDVQITGTPPGPPLPSIFISTVFVASMDEGGGGLNTRQNVMYRSVNGGTSFTSAIMGPRFAAVGDSLCSSNTYFAKINPIWRHMGWGEPAVGPNQVVHYVFAGKGSLSTGDVFYTRSTDNGSTWSTPVLLNDPETNQFQSHWMPSLSVNYNPALFVQPKDVTASWYDRRQSTTACNNVGDAGCNYERVGIQSHDNGATWGSTFAISDQIIPEPAQNDGLVQPCYAGDYDYSTAFANNAYVTWTDGRVNVSGTPVQSVEGDAVPEP